MAGEYDDYSGMRRDIILGYLAEVPDDEFDSELRLAGKDNGKPRPKQKPRALGLGLIAAHLTYCMGWHDDADIAAVLRVRKPSYRAIIADNARKAKEHNWDPGCPIHNPRNLRQLQALIDRAGVTVTK